MIDVSRSGKGERARIWTPIIGEAKALVVPDTADLVETAFAPSQVASLWMSRQARCYSADSGRKSDDCRLGLQQMAVILVYH